MRAIAHELLRVEARRAHGRAAAELRRHQAERFFLIAQRQLEIGCDTVGDDSQSAISRVPRLPGIVNDVPGDERNHRRHDQQHQQQQLGANRKLAIEESQCSLALRKSDCGAGQAETALLAPRRW